MSSSSSDKTQFQSTEDIQQSQDLSLEARKPPSDVPGYTLKMFLGSGAYGEVWSGIDRKTGRKVAIKFYTRKTSTDFTMLSREVEKLVYLAADRYVVQLLDVGWDAQPPYYVMDYIENGSLEDDLKRRQTIPVDEAVELFEEIAIGLMHLHGKGILHCDLKPGNILLDQDKKPRLADFGQSRLSHEESPALGTLFFMAPEQADLKAIPDARWDVYALGALLYSMLTGSPPYRDPEAVVKLENHDGLDSRLKAYNRLIQTASKPVDHRNIVGVDKWLGDIVSRCISADPKNRFASIQSVLLALRQRKETMARRPLMMLGIIGPLILLSLMSSFAWWAYNDAVKNSDKITRNQASESNQWAAKFAARSVAESIGKYFDTIDSHLEDPELMDLFRRYYEDPEIEQLALEIADPSLNNDNSISDARESYRSQPVVQDFSRHVGRWLMDPKAQQAASWTVNDRYGNQISGVWNSVNRKNTVGLNWSYRSYFNSSRYDYVQLDSDNQIMLDEKGNQVFTVKPVGQRDHIDGPKVSAVFKSKATNTWKVAFSSPVTIDGRFEGIVVVTVELGNFISFENGAHQYAMLVNGATGANSGIVLEHPLIRLKQKNPGKMDEALSERRMNMDLLSDEQAVHVIKDPLGYNPLSPDAPLTWIAAFEEVQHSGPGDTDLFVVTMQHEDTILQPSHDLGKRMLQVGIMALLSFVGVALGLGFLVNRSLKQARRQISRFHTSSSESSSINEAQTILASDHTPQTNSEN